MAIKKKSAQDAWEAFLGTLSGMEVVVMMFPPGDTTQAHCLTTCDTKDAVAMMKTFLASQEGRLELNTRRQ